MPTILSVSNRDLPHRSGVYPLPSCREKRKLHMTVSPRTFLTANHSMNFKRVTIINMSSICQADTHLHTSHRYPFPLYKSIIYTTYNFLPKAAEANFTAVTVEEVSPSASSADEFLEESLQVTPPKQLFQRLTGQEILIPNLEQLHAPWKFRQSPGEYNTVSAVGNYLEQ